MSQLSDRLREIVRTVKPRDEAAMPLQQLDQSVKPDQLAVEDLLECSLGGRWTHAKHCFVVERRTDAHEWYGDARVGDMAERIEDGEGQMPLDLIGAPATPPLLFF